MGTLENLILLWYMSHGTSSFSITSSHAKQKWFTAFTTTSALSMSLVSVPLLAVLTTTSKSSLRNSPVPKRSLPLFKRFKLQVWIQSGEAVRVNLPSCAAFSSSYFMTFATLLSFAQLLVCSWSLSTISTEPKSSFIVHVQRKYAWPFLFWFCSNPSLHLTSRWF